MITRQSIREKYPVKPLGVVADFLDNRRKPVKESDRKDGPFPYYGANGQQGNIDGYLFDEPLILLAEDGGFFDNPDRGIAYRISGKTWVNNHAHVLKPKAGMDFNFLCRVLENYDVMPYISGSTRAKLTKGQAEKIDIPVPPLDEQKRIAAILDQADNLRRKRQRAIDRLNQLGQAIFHEMFGEWDRSGSNAEILTLGDHLDFLTSGSRGWAEYYRESGGLFLRIQNVRRDELDLNDVAYVEAPQSAEARRTRVEPGDVLLSITADLGRTAVVPNDIGEAYINQHLAIIRSRSFNPRFLSAALSSPAGQRGILKRNREGVKAGLNFDDVRSVNIPRVPLDTQHTFAERLELVDKLKSNQRLALAEADSLFTSLQHRAFRGEL